MNVKPFLFLLFVCIDVSAACRNPAVKHQFDVMNGYPHGRKGYIVDHVCALGQGGIDSVVNMQYQTIADSKVKDRMENTPYGKKKWCNASNSTPTRQVFNCK
jgi:hypothetical protein